MSLISNFRRFPKSIGELPTSYRESISYEEQIIWLCNFIEKEILPSIDISQETVEELKSAFDSLQKEVEESVTNLQVDINQVKVYSDVQNELLKDLIENQIRLLNLRFDNIPDTLLVWNPTNGTQDNLNDTLNDIYSQTRVGALTAQEYDNLELTATNYDERELTATDYDTEGKELLSA